MPKHHAPPTARNFGVAPTPGPAPYQKRTSNESPFPIPTNGATLPFPMRQVLECNPSLPRYLFQAQKRLQAQLQSLYDVLPDIEGKPWNHPDAVMYTYLSQAITHMQIALCMITFTQRLPQIRDTMVSIPLKQPIPMHPDLHIAAHFEDATQYNKSPFTPPTALDQ
ncbi:hypothetical protein K474DRAFT_1713027 [Panus rudis PR-1116 ss-1]|nr:hypothetical protein K474DRAFT_1713027 [Panus rudis PR-1116 ss-1]